MQQHPRYTRDRIGQLVERLKGCIYTQTVQVTDLQISPAVDRIPYEAAQSLAYEPVQAGRLLGPQWATYWVRGRVQVPAAWDGGQVDFLWESHSEATLWIGGRSIGGINPGRNAVPLRSEMYPDQGLDFQVEIACNGLFGQVGRPYRSLEPFVLDQCGLGLFDQEAWDLYWDLHVLAGLEREEGVEADWRGHLLSELNRVANLLDPADRSTWPAARGIVAALQTHRNATYRHELSAVGHAHIDTAWLWPIEETWRKCVRTFSTAVLYMDLYPEYKFACSQAVQYAVIKERNPDLYRRIKEKAAAGQWVPVGGTWVEPDCNVPSGEALCRQFLFGQALFEREFGARCQEFWNPDVFGYNGQLPQIMQQSGIRYFLTQKLSWNHFNKPDHQTFLWAGIDGTEILTHFPPANTYNSDASIEELRRLVRDYRDNDRSGHSYMLFGIGDGGGGPTRDMLERLRRAADLQGLPRTAIRGAQDFFTRLEADCQDLPRVVGELYFELHRGTYTTQAAVKKGNRRGEQLLHDVEFLAAVTSHLGRGSYPTQPLGELWQLLLTNQFHDILPGSSITPVYADAARDHARIAADGSVLRDAALAALASPGEAAPVNTTSFRRAEVATRPDGSLAFITAPPYGIGEVVASPDEVAVKEQGGLIVLENGRIRATLDAGGDLISLVEKIGGREVLESPGNRLMMYDDHPTNWEAWDVDPFALETAAPCQPAETCAVVSSGPLRAEVEFTRKIGQASALKQRVRLDAGAMRLEFHTQVQWHESHRMLKVAFPVNVRALTATYEMQFGFVARPTHYNSTFDLARYEVPGHKWADLSEHGFGVSVLTDCKYGYHTYGNALHITLLRAPKSPDPEADMGYHEFAYAVYPHRGSWQDSGVVAEGFRFNVPVQWVSGAPVPISYFSVDDPGLVLDTVKQAEDGQGLVLRLYEAHGGRGRAKLRIGLPVSSVVTCNVLEDDGEVLELNDCIVELPYRPHQIISLRLR
jgi:alpha-mannosidase